MANTADLIAPHGKNGLVNLVLTGDELAALKAEATTLPQLLLTDRQLCDVECILSGAFSPLIGFLNQPDYERCVWGARGGLVVCCCCVWLASVLLNSLSEL